MLPCIVIDFFLNNQPDALIIQIYCYKTLRASGILSARRQEFSTVHLALVSFMQVFLVTRVRMELQFHPNCAWKRSSKKPAWNLPVPNAQ